MSSGKVNVHSENHLQNISHYFTQPTVDFFTTQPNLERQCSNELNKQPEEEEEEEEEEVTQLHKLQLKQRGYQVSPKKLGEGGFGVVYQVHSLDDNSRQLACKVMVLRKENMPQRTYHYLLQTFTSEAQIMQNCSHENIVSLRQHFIENHEKEGTIYGYIIMDFANLGSLYARLKSSGPFDETTARDMFGQTANALEYLHQQGIAHLDLTLANILLTKNNDREVLKLTDFGLSCKVYSEQSGLTLLAKPVGTLFYMSPELIEVFILYYTDQKETIRPYNGFCADLWALGICLYMMLCKVNPFKNNPVVATGTFQSLHSYNFVTMQSEGEGGEMQGGLQSKKLNAEEKDERIHLAKTILTKQLTENQRQVPERIEQNTSESCLQMIRGLLTNNPQSRLNIGQVQTHIWLGR